MDKSNNGLRSWTIRVVPAGPSSRPGLALSVLRVLTAILLLCSGAASAQERGCTTLGGLYTSDQTVSGQVCVTSNLTLRATLTVLPGSEVSICSECQIQVTSSGTLGTLVAEGTADQPIVFKAADPSLPWRRLLFASPVSERSVLRHVVIQDAGSRSDVNEGALHIIPGLNDLAVPVIDQTAILGSSNFGLMVMANSDDPTPPSITRVSIDDSARAAVRASPMAINGMDNLTLSNNGSDRIEVIGQTVYRDLTFRNHGYPYELLGSISVRDIDQLGEPTRVRIDPGVTVLLHPEVDVNIGTLFDANVALEIEGTAADPVSFLAVGSPAEAGDFEPWGQLRFGLDGSAAPAHKIAHASFNDGGGALVDGALTASLEMRGRGHLTLDHVTVTGSSNGGVYLSSAGTLSATDSRFVANRAGMILDGFAQLRLNDFSANPEGGLINRNPDDVCVDAAANFWGDVSGPEDASDAFDACSSSATNGGFGSSVSDGVLYRPFLASAAGEIVDRSSISPEPTWVTADGVSEAVVTITLRNADGVPIPGMAVELESTLGVVEQPVGTSDEFGRLVARLRSSQEGVARLTARNTTENADLGALGAVVFWTGSDGLGLVASGGTPYLSPQLRLERPPFEQGFPMTFSVPMKNANPTSVNVELTYSVAVFGIGAAFQDVGTVNTTLAPGEEWDAALSYIPEQTGHRCVRVRGTVSGLAEAEAQRGSINFPQLRLNFDMPDDPCDDVDVTKLVPNKDGIGGVARHMARALVQAYLVKECLSQELIFGRSLVRADDETRDYTQLVIPPEYTPPPLDTGNGVDAAEASAATNAGQAAADLIALDEARRETRRRARDAARAGDDLAAVRQEDAYIGFQLDYADALDALAGTIDDLLAVTAGENEPDTNFGPNDLADYITDLEQNGYDEDTLNFHLAFGRSVEEIAAQIEYELDRFNGIPQTTTTFYGFLRAVSVAAVRQALTLRSVYDATTTRGAASTDLVPLGVMEIPIEIGHDKDTTQTVALHVRPVEVPLDWSWSLDQSNPTLEAGQTTTVMLSINPGGGRLVRGASARLSVEGYIDDELVGGVLVEKRVEMPEVIFSDGFEMSGVSAR